MGKHSKNHLIGSAAGNASGERLHMFAIRKTQRPRCFKGVKYLPCQYRALRNSWTSTELFEDWIMELD